MCPQFSFWRQLLLDLVGDLLFWERFELSSHSLLPMIGQDSSHQSSPSLTGIRGAGCNCRFGGLHLWFRATAVVYSLGIGGLMVLAVVSLVSRRSQEAASRRSFLTSFLRERRLKAPTLPPS